MLTKLQRAALHRLHASLDVQHRSFSGHPRIRSALASPELRLYLETFVFPDLRRLELFERADAAEGEEVPAVPLHATLERVGLDYGSKRFERVLRSFNLAMPDSGRAIKTTGHKRKRPE